MAVRDRLGGGSPPLRGPSGQHYWKLPSPSIRPFFSAEVGGGAQAREIKEGRHRQKVS
jgi:hypothetical protein